MDSIKSKTMPSAPYNLMDAFSLPDLCQRYCFSIQKTSQGSNFVFPIFCVYHKQFPIAYSPEKQSLSLARTNPESVIQFLHQLLIQRLPIGMKWYLSLSYSTLASRDQDLLFITAFDFNKVNPKLGMPTSCLIKSLIWY